MGELLLDGCFANNSLPSFQISLYQGNITCYCVELALLIPVSVLVSREYKATFPCNASPLFYEDLRVKTIQ